MSSNGGRQAETFWHQCLIITILCVAAGTIFYSLDEFSLSPNELANILTCKIDSWFCMIAAYRSQTGMPPIYPTLLCQFTGLMGTSDFSVRLPSALAGLVSIYFLYMIGRDFISPTAGILAAAVMASNYSQAAAFSREATYISLLMLACLAHSYCFCRLFLHGSNNDEASERKHRFQLGFAGELSQLQWTWNSALPYDGRCLVSFWFTGILVFYTSNSSLILLGSEFLASIFLVESNSGFTRCKLLHTVWMPLLIASVPGLFSLYGFMQWVLAGNLFVVQSMAGLWQKLHPLLPTAPLMLWCLIVLIIIFATFIIITKGLKKTSHANNYFLVYALYQSLVALMAIWLLTSCDYQSLLYFWWVFILLLMTPVSWAIDSIPKLYLKVGIATLLVLIIIGFQTNVNKFSYRYNSLAPDFRMAAQIIHDDSNFMKSWKVVFRSSNLFDHYLSAYGINNKISRLLDRNTPPDETNSLLNNTEFYYLEYIPYSTDPQDTATFQKLSAQYKTLCVTRTLQLHVIKYSTNPTVTTNPDQDCRAYLSGTILLK